jgi:hypothetical protein
LKGGVGVESFCDGWVVHQVVVARWWRFTG